MELLPELPRQYNAVEIHKILNDFMQRAVGDNIVNFVDRGDPAAWDFVTANLTTDGTWRDLDLSSIIPAGTKSVLLRIAIVDDAAGSIFQLKRKGNSNDYNASEIYTQVINVYSEGDFVCHVSNDRKLQYKASNLTWGNILILVKGWFI